MKKCIMFSLKDLNIYLDLKLPLFVHTIESDESSAQLSIIEKQGSTKLSDQFKTLVSVIIDKDLETSKETYANSWGNIAGKKEKELLINTLDIVGLCKDRIEKITMKDSAKFL